MNKFQNVLEIAKLKADTQNEFSEKMWKRRYADLKQLAEKFDYMEDGRRKHRIKISPHQIDYDALKRELKSHSNGGRYPYTKITRILGVSNEKLILLGKGKFTELSIKECTMLYRFFGDVIIKNHI